MRIASFTLVAFFSGLPLVALAAPSPHLAIEFASNPAYSLAATCDVLQPIVTLNVIVRNDGTAANPTKAGSDGIVATDAAGTLGGNAALPSIEPGALARVGVPLRRLGTTSGAALVGTHAMTVSIGTLHSAPLAVPLSATFCAPIIPVSPPSAPKPGPVFNEKIFSTIATTKKRPNPAAVFTIAAPTNLKSAAGGADCGAHVGAFGALVCPDMIKSGDLLLIWDWKPGAGPDAIDGYRVYRVDGAAQKLVYTQANKKELTLVDVAKPAGSDSSYYAGKCYAVAAYIGATQSALSPKFCAAGGGYLQIGSAATTTTLQPKHVRSSERTGGQHAFVLEGDGDSSVGVGYDYWAQQGARDYAINRIRRSGILFDVLPLRNRRIVSAKLRMTIARSEGQGSNHSCITDLGVGTGAWWASDGWIEGLFIYPQQKPSDTGPQVVADVTPIVALWLREGAQNNGFVLKNSDENTNAFTTKKCKTWYSSPVLEITYY